uniref:Uncharacterized protein LOC111122562 n=1 Tax=Crassostrea virginica TaxID=6565 RepID=A0A8B8CZX0_CRAVI|nr:uncharacterized protein LOC111122562 [Crassostrea virginica]
MQDNFIMEDFMHSAYSGVCFVLRNVQHYGVYLIKINYDVISAILCFLSEVTRFLVKFMQTTFYVVVTLLTAITEFLSECLNFLKAFLQLLWKFVLLLFSILDLALKGLEQVIYFIWSGGKWTVGTLSTSVENIHVISLSIWEYLVFSFNLLLENLSNAISFCGQHSLNFIVGAYNFSVWVLFGTASLVDSAMMCFADSVRFVVDAVYYALTNIVPNTHLETYMGILIIVLFYAAIVHAVSKLYSRGYTFPYPRNVHQYNVPYPRFGNEFSDDEFGMSADEENDSETDSSRTSLEEGDEDISDEDEFSDEASELSVIDESEDDNSSNESDDSVDTIDIQLPAESQYNLRRSATPNRQKKSNSDIAMEMEREREKQMCVVCQDNKKSVLILPCRHMCLCVDCGNRIARARPLTRRICPLCREKIRTIMNVYL